MAIDVTGKRASALATVQDKGGFVIEFRRPVYVDRVKTGDLVSYGLGIETDAEEPIDGSVRTLRAELLVPALAVDASGVPTGSVLDVLANDDIVYLDRVGVVKEARRVAPTGEAIIYQPMVEITRRAA